MALIALAALIGLVLGVVACLRLLRDALHRRATDLADDWQADQTTRDIAASLQRSQAVLRGQMVEHLVPMFDEATFPDVSDARFLGRPVDFIIFDGYGDVRAGRADRLREVVFVDVKTGTSRLSAVERSIKACVDAGRVRAVVIDRPRGQG